MNHAAVQREQSRLVAAAREHFGGWDEALAAAGVVAGPPHGVPELRGLRRVRLSRGYSQAALGARAGVGAGQISALEAGKYRPRSTTAEALARALAVDVAELVRG